MQAHATLHATHTATHNALRESAPGISLDSMPPMNPTLTGEFLARLENHKRILFKVAYLYCRDRDDRQDLVQEMLIQCWRSYARFDERVQFSTWIYRVAVNVAISHFRREGTRIRDTVPLEDYGLNIAAADALFDDDGDNMRALRQLINGLDELNRALILLFLEGFNSEEIAAVVGISASNVSTRINRLKSRLQAEFNAQTEGQPT
ncbi:MAG: RNA polymerase sigma factor [Burkholderiales bacterium]|nr:RNA polymerase sigma factor [Burkholderiales bacterium]